MKKKTIFILITMAIIMSLIFVLFSPKNDTRTVVENGSMINTVKTNSVFHIVREFTGESNKFNTVFKEIKPGENYVIPARLNSLINESIGETPTEHIMYFGQWVNGVPVDITNKTMMTIPIRVENNMPEIAEYIKITREYNPKSTETLNKIEPVVEIQGEWIMITYPTTDEKLPRIERGMGKPFFLSFYIDIKTKGIISIWQYGIPSTIRAGYQPQYID